MFGVSFSEIVVIFIVALIVFGPDKLPGMARNFGKVMRDIKGASDSLRREFYNSVYDEDLKELRRNPQSITDTAKKAIMIPSEPAGKPDQEALNSPRDSEEKTP